MFVSSEYQLIDFGAGRKLERFGNECVDRPSPAADGAVIAQPERWEGATARFEFARGTGGGGGKWNEELELSSADESAWSVCHRDSRLLLHRSGTGNVGLFPEQAGNWDWIAAQVARCAEADSEQRPRVLNLFAYTGGASLAAANAGAEVSHVDSSSPSVAWAKRNAEASEMSDLPIRWLVEDAVKFVDRECRRGNTYDGIILDPPTYGHGPKGKTFKFGQHIQALMEGCGALLQSKRPGHRFLLFSCHTPGFDTDDAVSTVTNVAPPGGRVTGRPLTLDTPDGRRLAAGISARWRG